MAKRDELLPLLTAAFVELGYRRATTAELARRCGVQETTLYRNWPDKKAMFAEAIDFVSEKILSIYQQVLKDAGEIDNPAEKLLEYESKHLGEFRNYRIVFAALSETQEPEIRDALQRMYHRLHAFIVETIARSRPTAAMDAVNIAWGIMGLGTMMTIMDELNLANTRERGNLFRHVGGLMITED